MAARSSLRPDCAACAVRASCFVPHAAPAVRDALLDRTVQRHHGRGHVVSQQGDVVDAVRVLRSGSVLVLRSGLDGQARPIAFMVRGSALGLPALLGQPSQGTSRVQEAVRTCEIPVAALRQAAGADAALLERLRAAGLATTGRMADWSQVARAPGLLQQVAASLLLMAREQDGEEVQVPGISAWAALLGAGRDGIARALATLAAEGLVHLHARQRCRIDAEGLARRLGVG